jgi:hypothetical protein
MEGYFMGFLLGGEVRVALCSDGPCTPAAGRTRAQPPREGMGVPRRLLARQSAPLRVRGLLRFIDAGACKE